MTDSQVKLFLSVDIAGSTQLKNTNNYFQIQRFCENYKHIASLIDGCPDLELKGIYEQICKEESYQDWSQIISRCFDDFNTQFTENLDGSEICPWKMAGDELMYCVDVKTRKDVHDKVLAFFKTLRFFDKRYMQKGSQIRLKGSAWTAGFPIRNRILKPVSITNELDICKDCRVNLDDYMGPEIDIGFRLGKFTFPGIIVVSLELACILLDRKIAMSSDKSYFRVIDTGWEVLKGVWHGRKYPILCLALPKGMEETAGLPFCYTPYQKWDIEENSHVKKYAEILENDSGQETFDSITELIETLPRQLGVVRPYFVDEKDEIPPEHKKRLDFIKLIEKVNNENNRQDIEFALNSGELNSQEVINQIINDVTKQQRLN